MKGGCKIKSQQHFRGEKSPQIDEKKFGQHLPRLEAPWVNLELSVEEWLWQGRRKKELMILQMHDLYLSRSVIQPQTKREPLVTDGKTTGTKGWCQLLIITAREPLGLRPLVSCGPTTRDRGRGLFRPRHPQKIFSRVQSSTRI